ncbi:hypothetical protein PcP3B5_22520 [Pseudomonas citronellolis]|nr:hypothetical protein PcP3B5_22520 [Pseudomonas citronellolis]
MIECESFIHDRGEVPFPGVFSSKYPRGKTGAIQVVSSQANAIGRSRTGSGQPGWYPGELRQHHATPSDFFAPPFRRVRPPQATDGSSGQPSLPLHAAIIFQAYQRTSTSERAQEVHRPSSGGHQADPDISPEETHGTAFSKEATPPAARSRHIELTKSKAPIQAILELVRYLPRRARPYSSPRKTTQLLLNRSALNFSFGNPPENCFSSAESDPEDSCRPPRGYRHFSRRLWVRACCRMREEGWPCNYLTIRT